MRGRVPISHKVARESDDTGKVCTAPGGRLARRKHKLWLQMLLLLAPHIKSAPSSLGECKASRLITTCEVTGSFIQRARPML